MTFQMPERAPDHAITLDATFPAITRTLVGLRKHGIGAAKARLDPMWELALAEAANNVVEHAYRGRGGRVRLALWLEPGRLLVRLTDRGKPMPAGTIENGMAPAEPVDLPEGGFGWTIIRQLASHVEFCRHADENRLTLILPRTGLSVRT